MSIQRLLVANRGEIAVRILRTATELGIATAAIHSSDDASSDHIQHAETVIPLEGIGPAAYLDIAQIVERAREHECDAIHPGYGFLSENADFARACEEAGITFVGAVACGAGAVRRQGSGADACGGAQRSGPDRDRPRR